VKAKLQEYTASTSTSEMILETTNWKECGRKWSWSTLTYHLTIFLKELKKTKKRNQKSHSPGQESKEWPTAQGVEVLTTTL
jgi:hypothetical protein